ncbi:MAG: hypothetical protein LBT65_01120 [Synergistaceae bacterium]|jgi:hypothetical protein|nr:hypothetical protein [Synergistaceae bacterium]
MGGVYVHNPLCENFQGRAEEDLPVLEDEVSADESLGTTVVEDYETLIENDWAEFIKDFCI